ncbi:hypothetical protein [Streptomyces sp. NPDC002640]
MAEQLTFSWQPTSSSAWRWAASTVPETWVLEMIVGNTAAHS